MLQKSDEQGRPLIQLLILHDWDNDNRNLLTILGGIDKDGNEDQGRIDLITNTIKGLRAEQKDCQTVNDDKFRDHFV